MISFTIPKIYLNTLKFSLSNPGECQEITNELIHAPDVPADHFTLFKPVASSLPE